jgi:hypothetical protein
MSLSPCWTTSWSVGACSSKDRWSSCKRLAPATEDNVLERIHRGLLADGSLLAENEAGWVICRLAELLDWSIPEVTKGSQPLAT